MNDVAAEESDLWRENPHRVGKESDDVRNSTTNYSFLESEWGLVPHLVKTHQIFTKALVHILTFVSITTTEIAKSTYRQNSNAFTILKQYHGRCRTQYLICSLALFENKISSFSYCCFKILQYWCQCRVGTTCPLQPLLNACFKGC